MKLYNETSQNITFSDTGKLVKFAERISVGANSNKDFTAENVLQQVFFNREFQNQVYEENILPDFEDVDSDDRKVVGNIRKFLNAQTDWENTSILPGTYMCGGIWTMMAFYIMDVSDPNDIKVAGAHTTAAPIGRQPAIYRKNNHIYVLIPITTGGLEIVDITDPTTPVLVATETTSITAQSVRVQGDYAYLVDTTSIYAIDISDPTTPTVVGTNSPGGMAGISLWVEGNYAYVINSNINVHIIDISNPAVLSLAITIVGGSQGDMWGITKYGNYLLIAQGPLLFGGIEVIDVTQVLAPIAVGNIATGIGIYSITVDGDTCYFSSANLTYSMSLEHLPTIPTTYDIFNSYGYGLQMLGTHMYVTGFGFRILDVPDPYGDAKHVYTFLIPGSFLGFCLV
jgi:hypothetical protein